MPLTARVRQSPGNAMSAKAHNLKVTGSNPVPATKFSCESKALKTPSSERTSGFFLFGRIAGLRPSRVT